jgi:release factor glutamine methyltransferase
MTQTALQFEHFRKLLINHYGEAEGGTLMDWLIESILGYSKTEIYQRKDLSTLPPAFLSAVERLLANEPIQYILGQAPFYGRTFIVSPDVLIPRNETEELVHLIIKKYHQHQNCSILDIGTGSGCIPVTLALEMPNAQVYALDVSQKALSIARKNSLALNADVRFLHLDILQDEINLEPVDIIVSNPPYVKYTEKSFMHPNVLDHEPHLALFVPDDDPLIFYKVILFKSKTLLKPKGNIYFEINEAHGQAVLDLMVSEGYLDVKLHKDLNGKDRMVTGYKD